MGKREELIEDGEAFVRLGRATDEALDARHLAGFEMIDRLVDAVREPWLVACDEHGSCEFQCLGCVTAQLENLNRALVELARVHPNIKQIDGPASDICTRCREPWPCATMACLKSVEQQIEGLDMTRFR